MNLMFNLEKIIQGHTLILFKNIIFFIFYNFLNYIDIFQSNSKFYFLNGFLKFFIVFYINILSNLVWWKDHYLFGNKWNLNSQAPI